MDPLCRSTAEPTGEPNRPWPQSLAILSLWSQTRPPFSCICWCCLPGGFSGRQEKPKWLAFSSLDTLSPIRFRYRVRTVEQLAPSILDWPHLLTHTFRKSFFFFASPRPWEVPKGIRACPWPGSGWMWWTQGRGRDAGWKESSLPALGWGGRRAGILEDHAREGPLRVGARRVTRGDEWSLWLRGTPRRSPPVLSSPTANLGGRQHLCLGLWGLSCSHWTPNTCRESFRLHWLKGCPPLLQPLSPHCTCHLSRALFWHWAMNLLRNKPLQTRCHFHMELLKMGKTWSGFLQNQGSGSVGVD